MTIIGVIIIEIQIPIIKITRVIITIRVISPLAISMEPGTGRNVQVATVDCLHTAPFELVQDRSRANVTLYPEDGTYLQQCLGSCKLVWERFRDFVEVPGELLIIRIIIVLRIRIEMIMVIMRIAIITLVVIILMIIIIVITPGRVLQVSAPLRAAGAARPSSAAGSRAQAPTSSSRDRSRGVHGSYYSGVI